MSTELIDKYEIISTLGRGSMGVVYKARDPEIGRIVAVKTLRSVFMGNDPSGNEALQRFRQESRSAGRLQHPNIVTIFATGRTDSGSPYIVMEYIEGERLDQVITERHPLDPLEVLHYLSQVASAIDYAHSQNVIHRDIKPSNIIVDTGLRPHLLDFGVAKLSDTSLTPAGTVVGTPSYMSPEQIRGETLEGLSDLFSFAVVTFEMFTSVRPFPGKDFTTVVNHILHKEPLSFAELKVNLSPAFEQILRKALAKDKKERYQSALQFIDLLASELGALVDGAGVVGGFRRGMTLESVRDSSMSKRPNSTEAPGALSSARTNSPFSTSALSANSGTAKVRSDVTLVDENFPSNPPKQVLSNGKALSGNQASVVVNAPIEAKGKEAKRKESSAEVPKPSRLLYGFWLLAIVVIIGGVVAISDQVLLFIDPSDVASDSASDSADPEVDDTEVVPSEEVASQFTVDKKPVENDQPIVIKEKSSVKEVTSISKLLLPEISGLSDSEFMRLFSSEELQTAPSQKFPTGLTVSDVQRAFIVNALGRPSSVIAAMWKSLALVADYRLKVDYLKVLGDVQYRDQVEILNVIASALMDSEFVVRGFAAKTLGDQKSSLARIALEERLRVETHDGVRRIIEQAIARHKS